MKVVRMEKYEDWLTGFGNRIKDERERQKLTRSALAELAHTEQGYIVQIERGSRSPSLKTFTNLLTALGVSADYLIFGAAANEENENEGALKDFANLLKRGDAEDIQMLYQLAAHMMRSKKAGNYNEEFGLDFDAKQGELSNKP